MNNAKERFLWSESDIEWLDVEVQRGGPGSGHHGHAGRPGEVGGSAPSSGQGVAEGEAPYGTEGKKRIVRIISVRDTRDYDDSSGEWKPIPGTGEEHYCDRCGKVHEIHATVELEDESYCVVGTTCARAEFSEQLRKRMASKVRAAKRLRVLELEMAEKKKNQQEWDSALAEVRGLSLPEVTLEEDTSFQGRPLKKARMGDAVIHFSIQDTFNDERRKTLINSWQMKRMNELGFGSVRPHFDKVKYEKDIARTLATLEQDNVVERGGPGSGHHGHAGRPGEVGGSVPSGESGGRVAEADAPYRETIKADFKAGSRTDRAKMVTDFLEHNYDVSALGSGLMKHIHWIAPDGRIFTLKGELAGHHEQAVLDFLAEQNMTVEGARQTLGLEEKAAKKRVFKSLGFVRFNSNLSNDIVLDLQVPLSRRAKGTISDILAVFPDRDVFWSVDNAQGREVYGRDRPGFYRKTGVVERGGPGSGHHDHEGRPGEVGGSLPSGQAGSKPAPQGGSRVAEADAPYVDEDEYRPKLDDFATWADTDALVWIDADNGDGTFDIEIISGHDRGASYDNVLADDLWEPDLDEIHLWIDKGPDESIGRAVESFGLTEDPREAGYILPDGTFLNLSGSNQGGEPGMRSLDHRDIGRILLDEEPGGTEGMVYFMDQTGAIRMNWATGYPGRADLSVDFAQTPTSDQKETLEYLLAEAAFLAWDYTIYDAEANDFRTVESRQIQDPTFDDLSQVFRDIKSADMRERSMLHRIFNMLSALVGRGGPGSGHYDHEGRPGEVGGSLPSGAVGPDQPKGGRGVAEGEAPYGVGDSIKASELPDLAYGDKNKVLASLDSLQNYVQNIARGERGERGQPGDERISKLLWELERQQGKAGDAQEHTYRRSWRAYNAFKDWMDREGIEPSMYFTDALAVLEPFAAEYDRVARDQIEQILERQESEGVGRREVSEEYLATVEGDTWRQHQIAVALGTGIGSFGPPWLEFDNVEAWDTKRGYDPRELMDDLINGGSVFTDKTKDAVFKAWLERAQTPGTGEWGFAKGIEAETGMSAEAFAFDAVAHSSQDRWVPSDESSQLWATAQLLNDGWQRSTQTPGGMLITEIASEIWGGESIDRERSTSSAEKLDRIDEPAVRAEATSVLESAYEKTQALFSEWGLKEGDTIRLFRGMNNAGDERWNPDGRFGAAEVDMWAASSWSSDLRSAHLFAKDSERGAIVVANVPIERILTTWYTGFPAKGEREYIVLGQDGIDSKVYFKNEGAFTIESYADPERFKTFDDLVARAKGPWRFHIDRVNADWLREYRDSLTKRGGPGSGHHDHEGRPGEVGGSVPSGVVDANVKADRKERLFTAYKKLPEVGNLRRSKKAQEYFATATEWFLDRKVDVSFEEIDSINHAKGFVLRDDSGNVLTVQMGEMAWEGYGKKDLVLSWISVNNKGTGFGSAFMKACKSYADGKGILFRVIQVTNSQFYRRFNWLDEPVDSQGRPKNEGWGNDEFIYTPSALRKRTGPDSPDPLDSDYDLTESPHHPDGKKWPPTNLAVERGGPGSGHHGHAGRPGEVGGSQPSGQGGRRVAEGEAPYSHVSITDKRHWEPIVKGFEVAYEAREIDPWELKDKAGTTSFWLTPDGRMFTFGGINSHQMTAAGALGEANEVEGWTKEVQDAYQRWRMSRLTDTPGLNVIMEMGFVRGIYVTGRNNAIVLTLEESAPLRGAQKRVIEDIFSFSPEQEFETNWSVWSGESNVKHSYDRKEFRAFYSMVERVERGGPGSGHHDHKGRPGEVGGSAPSGAILDPSIPDDIRATRFFHAADSEEGAQKRLASGDIQVGPGAGGREFLAPVAGRTYATSDLEYALIYALGGDIAGNEVGEWMQKKIDQDGRYGYIFEIDNNDLNNIQPDEDAIGRAIWKQTYPWLNGLAEVYLSDKMLHKVMDGEYIYWAKSGKILVDHINDKRKYEMIRDGASIANAGNLGFKNIWRVDKYNLPKYPKINYSEEETSEKKQARVDGIWELIEPDKIVERGGPGSGHHEHAGRPGEVGGSAPSGASKPRKIGGGRVSEAAPVYGVKPSSRQAADMMRRNYGVAEDIGVAAWIGPDGEGLAPKKDHQITAKDVLKKLGMHPDTYRNSITATVNMIDLGLIRYTRFQDIHGFTLPQSKITNAQKEAIVTIMARARGKRSGLDFLFDKAVVEPQQEHRYLEKMDGRQVVDMLDLNTDFWEVTPTTIRVVHRGGPGSGHHGHEGRPGEVGGSVPSSGHRVAETDAPYGVAQIEGRSIKDLLHVPRTERWNDIRIALDLVDQVHVVPRDVFKLPLKSSKSYLTGGKYRYMARTGKPKDMFVVLNEGDEEDELVQSYMLHEVGHWIDHAMLGNKNVFASPEYVTHDLVTPDADALTQWRAALKDSEAMKALIDYKGGDVDVEYTTKEGLPGISNYYYSFDFLRNAQTWKESFARAYPQWIAYKTQDDGMLTHYDNELRQVRNGAAPLSWEWDDFQPIADSMDEIFRSKGCLKE